MSAAQSCRRCGRGLLTKQIDNILANYCENCGSQPFGVNVKTRKGVRVDRSGLPYTPPLLRTRPAAVHPAPTDPAPLPQESAA